MDLLPPCKKPKLEGNGAAWRGGGGEPLGNFILDQENALTSMGNIVLLRKKIKLEDDGVAQASWRGGDEPPGNLILDRKDALASRKKLKLEDNGVAQPSGSGGDEEPPGNSILDQEDALASLGDHILLGKRPKLEEEGFAPPSVQGGDQEPPGNSILDQEDALASPGDRLLHREKPKLEDKPPANSIMDQEKALLSLIEYRSKEVELLKQMVAYYRSQADMAEKRLLEAQLQLTRIRAQEDVEKGSLTKINTSLNGAGALYGSVVQSQSSLLSNPMVFSAEAQVPEAATGLKPTSSSLETSMLSRPLRGSLEKTGNKSKTLFAEKGHQVFFQCVRKSASSSRLDILPSTYICGQHKRKLRTLVLNPVDDHVFLTSALDGVVNMWQVQDRGVGIALLSNTECLSPKQRRWPEDIAWHPNGDLLFAAYSADGGDYQISLLNRNLSGNKRVMFLEEKPHTKGALNSIMFMPWSYSCFVTGGTDHAVVLWREKNNFWKSRAIHQTQHTSAVMGVTGLQQKGVVLSAGSDKRVIGFDIPAERPVFKHQMDNKCMSVLLNPRDFNLLMVQTGKLGKQLHLFDLRKKLKEIHVIGWKQESNESQSALISQAWSPDGFYLSSGTVDPMIHIFDIRYSGCGPCQTFQAHKRRVFKAVWHQSLPLLTSISSDLNVGLHRLST